MDAEDDVSIQVIAPRFPGHPLLPWRKRGELAVHPSVHDLHTPGNPYSLLGRPRHLPICGRRPSLF